jgi:hypothetical protein
MMVDLFETDVDAFVVTAGRAVGAQATFRFPFSW